MVTRRDRGGTKTQQASDYKGTSRPLSSSNNPVRPKAGMPRLSAHFLSVSAIWGMIKLEIPTVQLLHGNFPEGGSISNNIYITYYSLFFIFSSVLSRDSFHKYPATWRMVLIAPGCACCVKRHYIVPYSMELYNVLREHSRRTTREFFARAHYHATKMNLGDAERTRWLR